MNILANSNQNRQHFYDQQQIEYGQQQIEYGQQQDEHDQQQDCQQQHQGNELFQLRKRHNSIPLSFKGMILVQLWRKFQSNSFDQYLRQQKQERDGKYNNSKIKKVQVKRQMLMRWYFNVYKSRIIKYEINKILCQQSISKGSFFYKLKKLIGQQQQQQQQIQQLQRQKQQDLKHQHIQQQLEQCQQKQQPQQEQEEQSKQYQNTQHISQQLQQQHENYRSLQQLQQLIDSRQLSISHIYENQNQIDLQQEDNDDNNQTVSEVNNQTVSEVNNQTVSEVNDQTVSRILLDIQEQYLDDQEQSSNKNNDKNNQNDSMIHLVTICNNNDNKKIINQSEQQQQIVINIQSNLYNAEDNLLLSNINNKYNLYNVTDVQQQQIQHKPILQNNQTIHFNKNSKQFESKHIQTVQYKQQYIQTTQTQLINTKQQQQKIEPIQITKQPTKYLYLSQQQQDQTDKLIKQYQKLLLLQFTKLNKIMRHIDQLKQQQHQ